MPQRVLRTRSGYGHSLSRISPPPEASICDSELGIRAHAQTEVIKIFTYSIKSKIEYSRTF